MATLAPSTRFKAFSAAGLPLAGGKLYSYQSGTTTPLATYTDQTGVTPNANPVILDSNGEASVWLGPYAYKFVLTDPAGTVLQTTDKIYSPNSSLGASDIGADDGASGSLFTTVQGFITKILSSSGSSIVGFIQAGVGAVIRAIQDKLREQVSLKDFGAVGDGVADDTIPVQNWLNHIYLNAAKGYAPPGTYLTSGASLTWNASKRVNITGAGRGATVFKKTGADSGSVFSFTISSGSYLELDLHMADFEVEAPGYANVNGITFDSSALVTMQRLRVKACFIGIEAKGLLVSSFRDVDASGNTVGIRFRRGTAGSQPYANAITLDNCRINGNSNWGIDYGQGSGLYIRDCDVESNGTALDVNSGGIIIRNTIDDETGFGLIDIDGLWLESNKGHSFIAEAATNGLISMRSVQVYAQELTRAIKIGAIRSATFENILCPSANAELVCEAELQNYVGNVYVFTVNTAGAAQVTGAYKTSVISGDTWTATKAQIGQAEVTAQLKLTRRASAPTTDTANGWAFQLQNASGATDGTVFRAGVFRFQKGDGSGADHAEIGTTWVYPGADNVSTLGAGSRRWSVVYAGTGTINTSDEREKQQIRTLSEQEKAVAIKLKGLIRAFKFNDAVAKKGPEARTHFGVIAQEVERAFTEEGLSAGNYALLCYDEWEAVPAVINQETGETISEGIPAGNRYGVRYEELIAFIISAI